jgi:hypothetical protein
MEEPFELKITQNGWYVINRVRRVATLFTNPEEAKKLLKKLNENYERKY